MSTRSNLVKEVREVLFEAKTFNFKVEHSAFSALDAALEFEDGDKTVGDLRETFNNMCALADRVPVGSVEKALYTACADCLHAHEYTPYFEGLVKKAVKNARERFFSWDPESQVSTFRYSASKSKLDKLNKSKKESDD